MRRTPTCLWLPGFFGLTSQYRVTLFQQIYEIIFYGGGGYDFHTVYNFPIWLRRLTHTQIASSKQAEADAYKKSTSSSDSVDIGSKNIPEHIKQAMKSPPVKAPSYVTKSTKK